MLRLGSPARHDDRAVRFVRLHCRARGRLRVRRGARQHGLPAALLQHPAAARAAREEPQGLNRDAAQRQLLVRHSRVAEERDGVLRDAAVRLAQRVGPGRARGQLKHGGQARLARAGVAHSPHSRALAQEGAAVRGVVQRRELAQQVRQRAARGEEGGATLGARQLSVQVGRHGRGAGRSDSVVIVRETVHTTQPDSDSNGVTTQPGLAKWLNRSAASCRNSRRHPYGNSTDGSDSK